jgi:nitroreductase
MDSADFVPLSHRFVPQEGAEQAARDFMNLMQSRRSLRDFSDRPVSLETIRSLIQCAGSAPSGANKQPWRFVCVRDQDLKRQIRLAAEQEEREFYETRAGETWLKDLEPLGTDPQKPFLEIAPLLIVVFKLTKDDDGGNVYYINESVGLACGFLIAAAHAAGLATLTHTPSPMAFLSRVLQRPPEEKPFLLIPVGYPADHARVPAAALRKKPLDQIMVVEG